MCASLACVVDAYARSAASSSGRSGVGGRAAAPRAREQPAAATQQRRSTSDCGHARTVNYCILLLHENMYKCRQGDVEMTRSQCIGFKLYIYNKYRSNEIKIERQVKDAGRFICMGIYE